MKIAVINGPNLNMLGKREPVYGNFTYGELKDYVDSYASTLNIKLDWFQSNIEGEIVCKINTLEEDGFDGLLINPAGYSHTSVAIYDALKIMSLPKIEVHLSQVYQRENFRQNLLTAAAADCVLCGAGKLSYVLGINYLKERMN